MCERNQLVSKRKEYDLYGFIWNVLLINNVLITHSMNHKVDKFYLIIDVDNSSIKSSRLKVETYKFQIKAFCRALIQFNNKFFFSTLDKIIFIGYSLSFKFTWTYFGPKWSKPFSKKFIFYDKNKNSYINNDLIFNIKIFSKSEYQHLLYSQKLSDLLSMRTNESFYKFFDSSLDKISELWKFNSSYQCHIESDKIHICNQYWIRDSSENSNK